MTAEDGGAPPAPVWARERARRASSLTREAIVGAAIDLADAQGLEAVSIRRVATVLAARAMSLYTYIDSKDDLFDLMTDQIIGELLLLREPPGDWREAVTLIARREREVGLRHPWLVDLVRHRTHVVVGPNMLRHLDQSVAAVSALKLEPQEAFGIVAAIDDYVLGHVTRESREHQITRRTGLTGAEQISAIRPYLQHLADSGELANIAPLLRGEVRIDDADGDFERGLRWILDGIEHEYS